MQSFMSRQDWKFNMTTYRTLNYMVPPINAEIFVLNLNADIFTAREDLLPEPKLRFMRTIS